MANNGCNDSIKHTKKLARGRDRSNSDSTSPAVPVTRSAANIAKCFDTVGTSGNVAAKNFNDLESRLLRKFEDLLTQLEAKIESRLVNKFEGILIQLEAKISKKIDDMTLNFNNRLTACETIIDKIQSAECSERVRGLEETLGNLQRNRGYIDDGIEELRRSSRASDIIIRGIPVKDKESPPNIFKNIAEVVKHQCSPFVDAFRLGWGSKSKESPIIVKFSCPAERRSFFSSLKRHGRLKLNQLHGFASDAVIYINDSLTPRNSKLLRNALALRSAGKVNTVITQHGFVYIRWREGDELCKITTAEQLITDQ